MKKLVLALLLVTLVSACATSPTGRRQLMLVSEQQAITASRQQYLQTMGKLKSEGKLVTDAKILKRVDTITGRLIAQAILMRPDTKAWEWSLQVIDDPKQVNAWCMAGGRMARYTGLIQKGDPTDDELAQVMGHEISHALANHKLCRERRFDAHAHKPVQLFNARYSSGGLNDSCKHYLAFPRSESGKITAAGRSNSFSISTQPPVSANQTFSTFPQKKRET